MYSCFVAEFCSGCRHVKIAAVAHREICVYAGTLLLPMLLLLGVKCNRIINLCKLCHFILYHGLLLLIEFNEIPTNSRCLVLGLQNTVNKLVMPVLVWLHFG
jgi:hypothetical protein